MSNPHRMLRFAREHVMPCLIPALASRLAGRALSLPSILVLRSIMGMKKTVVYVSLVIVMATITGLIYGALF